MASIVSDLMKNPYAVAGAIGLGVYFGVSTLKPPGIYLDDKVTLKYDFLSPFTLAAGSALLYAVYATHGGAGGYRPF